VNAGPAGGERRPDGGERRPGGGDVVPDRREWSADRRATGAPTGPAPPAAMPYRARSGGAAHTGGVDELAAFLRSRRERITPADVGLPARPRRRTPGLRREEALLERGTAPNITRHVLPYAAVEHPALGGSLTLFTAPISRRWYMRRAIGSEH
jgi:hypothetical protein